MTLKKYILLFISVLAFSFAKAQTPVEVHAVIDSTSIRIGAQTKLDIYVNYDASTQKNIDILWPLIEDTIKKGIEIVNISPIDTTIPNKNKPNIVQQHIQLTVTSFDTGAYYIAPFKFIINKDTANPLYTEPLHLLVNTVATDTSLTKVKDIKAPFDEPFDWKWYLPYAYWGLAILAAVIILIIVIRKLSKKKPQEVIIEQPKIPAHITALETLEKIKQEAIWKENKIKEYYSDIADTVRLYIEERFSINALELTSDEIIKIFKSQVVDSESKSKLTQILTLSDFVKFAKQIPIEAEHTLTLNNAFDFIKGTMREEVVNTSNANQSFTQESTTSKINNPPPSSLIEQSPDLKKISPNVSNSSQEKSEKTSINITEPKKPINKKKILGFFVGAITVVVSFFIIQKLFFSAPAFEEVMNATASEINAKCPITIDDQTRMDGAEVLPSKVFQYNYTLVNMSVDEINANELKNQIEPNILFEVKNNPQLQINRDNNVTMQYNYRDKSGNELFKITIGPDQYK